MNKKRIAIVWTGVTLLIFLGGSFVLSSIDYCDNQKSIEKFQQESSKLKAEGHLAEATNRLDSAMPYLKRRNKAEWIGSISIIAFYFVLSFMFMGVVLTKKTNKGDK